ncbi:MbeB family mobilization protein, partial [Enterobacter hormaechei]
MSSLLTLAKDLEQQSKA